MTMTETEHALTAQDVRALKHADSLCFDHLPDGTGRIRAIRRADRSDTGFEQVHEISAMLSRINDYEPTAHDGAYTGFAMIMSAQYDDVAQTLVRRLRTGSRFTLHWVRDNNSPVTRASGIVVDYLQIKVQAKGAKVADTFNVATFVGLDNTARMVRRA